MFKKKQEKLRTEKDIEYDIDLKIIECEKIDAGAYCRRGIRVEGSYKEAVFYVTFPFETYTESSIGRGADKTIYGLNDVSNEEIYNFILSCGQKDYLNKVTSWLDKEKLYSRVNSAVDFIESLKEE